MIALSKRSIRRAEDCGTAVLLDETYGDFIDSEWHRRCLEYDNVIVLRSFSKAPGLAGLRAGYLVSNKECASLLRKVRPFCELNHIACLAIEYLLEQPGRLRVNVEPIVAGRNILSTRLTAFGFPVINTDANFVLVDLAKSETRSGRCWNGRDL